MSTYIQKLFTQKLVIVSLIIHMICITNIAFGQPILTIHSPNDTNTPSKVAISPDWKEILTGLHSAKIWDAETGQEILHYTKTMKVIASAVFSPDGKYIFTGESGFRGQYWDRFTGELIFTIETFTVTKDPRTVYYIHGITACDFTPDGSLLLTGDSDGEVQLWDMSNGNEIRRYKERGGYVKYIKISPHGKRFFSHHSSRLYMIDLETDEEIYKLFLVSQVVISSNWKYLLTNIGYIYDVDTGKVIKEIPTFHSSRTLAISPNGQFTIVGGIQNPDTKEIENRQIFNNETSALIRSYPTSISVERNAPNSPDDHILFFPDGKRFLTVNNTNIHIWDISDLTAHAKGTDDY